MLRLINTLLLCFVVSAAFSQKYIFTKDYYKVKEGKYVTQSTKSLNSWSDVPRLLPQRLSGLKENTAFFKIDKNPILLFDNPCFLGNCKPVKVLEQNSFIQVDTVFYHQVYLEKGKEFPYTFNVWYKVLINNEVFYSDYKIHDFIAYVKQMEKFNQKLVLIAQSDGYDDYYDNSYPEKFFVVVLNKSNEVIFESSILPFDYSDEFFESDYVRSNLDRGIYKFSIQGEKNIDFTWDGSSIVLKE